jgi:rhomboid protease GluP
VKVRAIGDKLVYIFLPLLLLTVVFVAFYSLANWFLVAPDLVPLDQDLANIWLPIALSVILVGALIAPRLRVLKLSEKRNVPFLYQIAAMAVLAVPACFAQSYVTTASGVLTKVKSADMIASVTRTRYYAADSVCLDRQKSLVHHENEVSGKRDEYLEFKLYVLTPICESATRPVWIGLIYRKEISNLDDDALKEAKYRDFMNESQANFDEFDPSRIRYFEFLSHSSDRRNFEKALPKVGVASPSLPIILVPHLDAFEARNAQKLPWAFKSFGIAAGIFLLMLLIPALDSKKLAEARKPRSERTHNESNTWLDLILPRRDAYGLPILMDINLAVYLAMVFSGLGVFSFQVDDLRAWGANYGPAIHGIGTYRLISSQFVHGGIMHILSNMYGLLFAGLFLSPVIRKAGLIACYLVCGSGGNIASVMMHPAIVGVGASGAIMGLLGILLTLALLGDKRVVAGRGILIVNCLIFAGLTLAQGIANPGIDNAAHIGGLATGIVIGVLIFLFSWGAKAGRDKDSAVVAEEGVRT